MVEGPGTRNNARKARALVGNKVLRARGTKLDKQCATAIGEGKQLATVLSLGKELWLIFAALEPTGTMVETAVRLHFGMSGRLLVDSEAAPSRQRGRSAVPPQLDLLLAGGHRLVAHRLSSLKMADATKVRVRVRGRVYG